MRRRIESMILLRCQHVNTFGRMAEYTDVKKVLAKLIKFAGRERSVIE